jgi:hypothetical protein
MSSSTKHQKNKVNDLIYEPHNGTPQAKKANHINHSDEKHGSSSKKKNPATIIDDEDEEDYEEKDEEEEDYDEDNYEEGSA